MTAPALWPMARLRQIGSGMWMVAAVLAIFGTFLPLIDFPRSEFRQSGTALTLWGVIGNETADGFQATGPPPLGIPVVLAGALLLVGGILGLISTRLHPASAPVLASRLVGTGGAGMLIAAVTFVWILFENLFRPDVDVFGAAELLPSAGIGLWALIGGALLSVAAVVLMLVPKIAKRGEEPETPPMGIPVVRVLEPEYDETPEAEQSTDPKG